MFLLIDIDKFEIRPTLIKHDDCFYLDQMMTRKIISCDWLYAIYKRRELLSIDIVNVRSIDRPVNRLGTWSMQYQYYNRASLLFFFLDDLWRVMIWFSMIDNINKKKMNKKNSKPLRFWVGSTYWHYIRWKFFSISFF